MTRIAVLDIETAPIGADVWGLWKQNIAINQIHSPTRVISFASKWYGEKRVEFWSEHHNGQEAMIARAHEILDEADAVVGFNSERFDVPHLNREFWLADLPPYSPFLHIDLLKAARKQFNFPSFKLAYITSVLGLSGKLSHEGHTLWVKCLRDNDPKAWRTMRRYNMQDVRTTEELYDRMRAWIPNGPHIGLMAGVEESSCGRCGSTDLQRRGFTYTKLAAYQRFQCQSCKGWSRGKKAELYVDARAAS